VFDVSFFELLVIFLVVLVLFGPDKLPEFASKLGKLSGDLKKTTDSLRREFYNSVYKPADEGKQQLGSVARELRSLRNDVTQDLRSADPTAKPPAPPDPPLANDSNGDKK
jgi:TatA/E family protein of Tat protein translocase